MNPRLTAAYFCILLALLKALDHESDKPTKHDETSGEIAYHLPVGYGAKDFPYVSTAAAQVRGLYRLTG